MKLSELQLFQTLSESPISDDSDFNNSFNTNEIGKKFSSAKKQLLLKDKFPVLGKGSSRVVFGCDINASLLKADDIENIKPTSETIKTAIKLALNGKGLIQNQKELDYYRDAQALSREYLLCPIVDWAGNPKYKNNIQYTIEYAGDYEAKNGGNKAPFWIQMEQAELLKGKKFDKIFESYFGIPTVTDLYKYDPKSKTRYYGRGVYDKLIEENNLSEEQQEHFYDLESLCGDTSMTFSDLGRYANWGILNGKPVIIDYGFDDEVVKYYNGTSKVSAYVYSTGEVVIRED